MLRICRGNLNDVNEDKRTRASIDQDARRSIDAAAKQHAEAPLEKQELIPAIHPTAITEYNKSGTGLQAIPNDVSSDLLPGLKLLVLSRNQIKEVPGSFFASLATTITSLDLSCNEIKSLPAQISNLCKLEVLDVSHNQLAALPASLCQIAGLQTLKANNNQIKELSGPISHWTALQSLDLSSTKIEVLPADLGWLPLTDLLLHNNPRLRIPGHVLEKGLQAILSYHQVVREQHKLVDDHMARFLKPTGNQQVERPRAQLHDTSGQLCVEAIEERLQYANKTGILDLRRCAIPEAFSASRRLKVVYVLDARNNRLSSIPSHLFALNELVILNVSYNNIRNLEEGVVPATLSILNLSYNKLTRLPQSLSQAPVLQQVYLANNRLTDLPSSWSRLPIVDLFMSENMFTAVPEAVLGMTKLAKLSMACCQLTTIPPELGLLQSIKFLDLSFNNLTTLPQELEGLQDINALNLSFNPMCEVPAVVTTMTSLLELNLDYTDITDVPAGIGALENLQGLQMEGLSLIQPLLELYTHDPLLIVKVHSTTIQDLNLSCVGLTTFPERLVDNSQLRQLDLSDNQLTSLPPAFGHMTNLKNVNLDNNPLGDPFRQLLHLRGFKGLQEFCRATTTIDLCQCQLHDIPQEVLCNRPQIQELLLQKNLIQALPLDLSNLTSLQVLDLSSNSLSGQLQECIAQCRSVTALDVSGNQLTSLPSAIASLSSLRLLKASHNQLCGVPEQLKQCAALEELDLSNNNFPANCQAINLVASGLEACQHMLVALHECCVAAAQCDVPVASLEASEGTSEISDQPENNAGETTLETGEPCMAGPPDDPNASNTEGKTSANGARLLQGENITQQPGSQQDFTQTNTPRTRVWQRHLDVISKDPLRRPARSGWSSIPLTDIPQIMAALSSPPAPPTSNEFVALLELPTDIISPSSTLSVHAPAAQDQDVGCARPQSRQRFRRIMDQGHLAKELLARLQEGNEGACEAESPIDGPSQ